MPRRHLRMTTDEAPGSDQIVTGELNVWVGRLGLGGYWEAAKAHVD